MSPRGPRDLHTPRCPEKETERETTRIASERITVRRDGRRVCCSCGATLATRDGDVAWLVNGYQLRATAAADGGENGLPVYEAGRKAKAAFCDDRLKAARGDTKAQERLRTGQSTKNIRTRVFDAGPPELEEVEQARVDLRIRAETLPEPARTRALAEANGPAGGVPVPITRWSWEEPTGLIGRIGLGKTQHVLVECLACGKYNESGVVE